MADTTFSIRCIGHLESELRSMDDAPRQGDEGAPDAWLIIDEAYAPALQGVASGDELILVTWLHLADRTVLQTYPRNDRSRPMTGVFATRSPDRPNPLGLHRVNVREITSHRVRIGPLEAIDGTPVVDVKIVLNLDER